MLPDTAAAIYEFQSLPPTQQEKPKLQPNDESMIIVTDTNPISEDVREEFEPTQPQKVTTFNLQLFRLPVECCYKVKK